VAARAEVGGAGVGAPAFWASRRLQIHRHWLRFFRVKTGALQLALYDL
jgi:hypothetical protein